MHIPRLAGVCAAMALLCPVQVNAQFGLGPRIAVVRGSVEAESSSERYTGGLLRAHLSPRTAVELALDWRTMTNESLTERTRDYPFQGSLLLYPVSAPIAPYLLGGVGWYSQRVEALGAEREVLESTTTREFGYHAGFGGELRFGRHAAAHLDYRYTFLGVGNDEEGEEGGGITSALTDRLRLSHEGSMWTGGLTIYF
jgi:hypothetical protein